MASTVVEATQGPRPTITRSTSSRWRAHPEQHSDHGEVIRDVIIGFADGLTVPFALTAGLSSYGLLSLPSQ
jgi:hypothetical protein